MENSLWRRLAVLFVGGATVSAVGLAGPDATARRSHLELARSRSPSRAAAASEMSPLYNSMTRYSTSTIRGDSIDLYYPAQVKQPLPVALLLQGLNVDKAHYSQFAEQVGRYGFIVAVPNHTVSVRGRDELFAQVGQVTDVLESMRRETQTPKSPLYKKIDPETLVLLGHSHGGMMGLDAIRGACDVPFCIGDYTIPKELKAAAFYGTFLWEDGEYLSIDNSRVPTLLVAGSRDSLITPEEIQQTYGQIKYPPKMYVQVEGANHYGITDRDNPSGSPPEPRSPTLPQEQAIETIARWSAAFLRAYALEDKTALDYLYRIGPKTDTIVEVVAEP
ncbi:alpha/beta hydrolase family protein [Baaleninema sp.]|uniref:alpha/beta hydrolase family protein n=1 Tax=Baaleninema sp. TaxID=3101197 RepID=UPI003CFD11A0